ncbi:hypothetical protein SLEP1_g27556 [Rubroshorea leprosula]|uniref:Uncharacterized protein n=1 Tax=Rubroshorea leprosula TaxID=152421 RepID=A0AAV5JX93_9ROSI|nr:hypothetical protein SLEP1_g27556 [Rubroshorea leprosula]
MRRRCLGMLSLAVIVILLIGEVPEAASTDGASINVTASIAEFIGDEEFLMGSEVNARLLQDGKQISFTYPSLKKPALCDGTKYASDPKCLGQINVDNRGCKLREQCRQGG